MFFAMRVLWSGLLNRVRGVVESQNTGCEGRLGIISLHEEV